MDTMILKAHRILLIGLSLIFVCLISCKRGKRVTPRTSKERKVEKPKRETTIKIKPEISIELPEKSNSFQVKLKNNTAEEIYVAISYMDTNGDWIVSGWWNVEANKDYLTDISAQLNSEIYFYAESANDVSEWDGEYEKGFNSAILSVSQDEFEYKLKYKDQLDPKKLYDKIFYIGKQEINSGTYVETFNHPGAGRAG